jgi:hypothetical protein
MNMRLTAKWGEIEEIPILGNPQQRDDPRTYICAGE